MGSDDWDSYSDQSLVVREARSRIRELEAEVERLRTLTLAAENALLAHDAVESAVLHESGQAVAMLSLRAAMEDLQDALQEATKPPARPSGPTVRVSIPVVVGESGWASAPAWDSRMGRKELLAAAAASRYYGMDTIHWVEADLPIPQEVTVEGEVSDGGAKAQQG